MKSYEVAVLLHPDLEIDLQPPLQRLDELFKNYKVSVTKCDNWGKRKLAYQIARSDFAVYLFYTVLAEPARISELERALGLSDEVLRHLVVVHETPPKAKPTDKESDKAEASDLDDGAASKEEESHGA